MRRRLLPLALLALLPLAGACAHRPQVAFWGAVQALCGQSFEGRLVVGTDPGDAAFGSKRMVMEVRDCGPDEVRIPFTVGEDRSRTWVLTRQPQGLRLKHDHRHQDGTQDAVSQYGGDAAPPGTATVQHFPADAFTAELLPRAATNVWTLELVPGQLFAYALRREAEGRHFRVEFDLTHR